MKKFCDRCLSFCETAIKYLALLPLIFVFVSTVLCQNTITFDVFETSKIVPNGIKFMCILVLCVPVLYVGYRILKYLPEAVLFGILSLSYMIAGIYICMHMETVLRYDSGVCYWNALNFVEGNYTNLQYGEYFYKWPHQLGLVTYNCIWAAISDDVNLIYISNLVWIVLTNFFIWFIMCVLYEDRPILRKMTILLSFCFLPQFFYAIFAYGQVPGLCFLAGAIYFSILFLKKNKYRYILPCVLFLAIACILGMNYAIGGVALAIILLLQFFKTQKLRYLILIVPIIGSMFLPTQWIIGHYEKVADVELDNGMPFLLYVAMGLQENEEAGADWRANGWYNDFSSKTYMACECDVEKSTQIAVESIKERLSYFIRHPGYAVGFFKEKLLTTWCEPTYQCIWSGPLIVFGSTTDVPWLEELYTGGMIFERLASLMNILVVFIFGFAAWYVICCTFIHKRRLNPYELFSLLFFLGGFLFHLFWETKSRYVYFYVFMLIPVACCGIHRVFSGIDKKIAMWKADK